MIFPWTSSCHAINAWPRRSGNGNSIFRSKRPGRSSAGSSVSWRFLGAVSKVPGNLSNMYIYICIYIYICVCAWKLMGFLWKLYGTCIPKNRYHGLVKGYIYIYVYVWWQIITLMDNTNYGKLYGNTGIKLQLGGWIKWIGVGKKLQENHQI